MAHMTPSSLRTHKELHTGDFAGRMNWLRASVLGANDGIVSMAALIVGVAGAGASSSTLLITGVAGLSAGAFSMAVGEYVSVSSQKDTEEALLAKERHELHHEAEQELEELTTIYERKGLSRTTAEQVAKELTQHDAFTAHAEAELGIDPTGLVRPLSAGLASAISYVIGGLIPLIAILAPGESVNLYVTYATVAVALVLTGIYSARVSGAPALRTVFRNVAGGMLAMVITYYAGMLLGGVL